MKRERIARKLLTLAKKLTAGSAEQRELELYIMNDGELYRRQTSSIIKNLQRKVARDAYDRDKAVKLWLYLVDAGAKKYVQEHASPNTRWNDMFSKQDRIAVAKELRDYYEEEIMY
jgi:hypothetical protein